MSYDNAEPKILKTLDSSGQVLDDSGNVISETSDYWVKTYNQAEPKPDKILKSDGTIVDSEGNLIQDSTEFNIKKYNQAEPIPAKYLHADGTIDENSGSGGADLEDNKAEIIDVSTYTDPVEITPTAGKDGMKKATVTLNNIPSSKPSSIYSNHFYGGSGIDGYTLIELWGHQFNIGDTLDIYFQDSDLSYKYNKTTVTISNVYEEGGDTYIVFEYNGVEYNCTVA